MSAAPNDEIMEWLGPMLERANRERFWFFYHSTVNVTIPPKKMRAIIGDESWSWRQDSWKLVDPPAFKDLEIERERMIAHNEALKKQIDEGWES